MASSSYAQRPAHFSWQTSAGHNTYPQPAIQRATGIYSEQTEQSREYSQYQQSQCLRSNWSNECAPCSHAQSLNVLSSDIVRVVSNGAHRMTVQERRYTVQQQYHYEYMDPRTRQFTQIHTVTQHEVHEQIVQWIECTPTISESDFNGDGWMFSKIVICSYAALLNLVWFIIAVTFSNVTFLR